MARGRSRGPDPARSADLVDPVARNPFAHLCRARRVRHRNHRNRAPRVSRRRTPVTRAGAIRAPVKLHYAWIVAAVTFVVLLLTAGIRAAPGVLIVPLEDEFHWSRATISFAVGVNILLYGLVGPFAAALMDRFGVRRTMVLALAFTASGVALSPVMRQSWQFILLWGGVAGAGSGVIGAFLAAYIPARWFRARQGLVVGVLMASNAAGQLVFLPTMATLA